VRSAAWYCGGRYAPSKHYERRRKCQEVTDKARPRAADKAAVAALGEAPDAAVDKAAAGDAWVAR